MPVHKSSAEIHLPTVAEILALPSVRKGRPTVEAAQHATNRPVRWVHVSEVPDIAHLLQGGELILSTGVAFPSTDHGLERYTSDLAAAHATGVMIELGRRFTTLPPALVQSAEAHSLPLIALHHEVPFVAITEAIHSIIVNSQIRQLQLNDAVHQAFRSLAVEAATPQDIINQVAQLAGCPCVFENVAHHVLAFCGTTTGDFEILDDWEMRSHHAAWTNHTTVIEEDHWIVTPVSARGHVWGRLILLPTLASNTIQRTILELGATTLALHLLIEHEERLVEHQTHRTLITDIIEHRYSSPDQILSRIESLGVPARRSTLQALIVLTERDAPVSDVVRHARAREEANAISKGLSAAQTVGLVGQIDPGRFGVLICAPTDAKMHALLNTVAHALHEHVGKLIVPGSMVIGVGSSVKSIDELRYSFAEAIEAADAAVNLSGFRLYATTADIGLEGLVHLLKDDPRLRSYAERELSALIDYDERHHSDLVATLTAYLGTGGNKSATATALYMNRATFYHRLARIEKVLNCDLESPECRYSLYVALVAHQSLVGRGKLT
jgi:purine catabolism regulator